MCPGQVQIACSAQITRSDIDRHGLGEDLLLLDATDWADRSPIVSMLLAKAAAQQTAALYHSNTIDNQVDPSSSPAF